MLKQKPTETEIPLKSIDFQLFRSILVGQKKKKKTEPNQLHPYRKSLICYM